MKDEQRELKSILKSFSLSCKTRLTAVLTIACLSLPLIFHLGCITHDGVVMGTVTITHELVDIPENVEHLHYIGYDSSGNIIYESPEQEKSSVHWLFGVPLQVVTLSAKFHTAYHEELNINSYPVSFAETTNVHIQANYINCVQFIPDRLALVDTNDNGNILVRGNMPLITKGADDSCLSPEEWYFAYSALDEKMKTVIPGFNLDEYEIIDITLIDNRADKDQLTAERNSLGGVTITCGNEWYPYSNPDCAWDPTYLYETTLPPGQHPWGLVWWPIYACGSIPCNDENTKTGLEDFRLNDLPRYLITLLQTPSVLPEKPKLIYFHCMLGADRTGALHALYLMETDPSLTINQAFDRASWGQQRGSGERPFIDQIKPVCPYVSLAQKYCQEKYPLDTTGKCDLSDEWSRDNWTKCK